MLTFWTIVLILLTLSVHELGHAWAMREKGVSIKRVALLGIPWPNITLRLPIKSSRFPGTEWVIHPLVLGAYVEPKEGTLEKVSHQDSIYIYAMGPIASVLIGVVLMGFARLGMQLDHSGITPRFFLEGLSFVALVGGMWYFRAWIAKWLCPVLSIATLTLVVIVMWFFGAFESLAGPIGLVSIISEHATNVSDASGNMAAHGIDYFSTWRILSMAGLISILIGVSNLMPFLPLDGGHIIKHFLPQSWQKWYPRVSAVLFIWLVVIAFASDFMRIF